MSSYHITSMKSNHIFKSQDVESVSAQASKQALVIPDKSTTISGLTWTERVIETQVQFSALSCRTKEDWPLRQPEIKAIKHCHVSSDNLTLILI